MSECKHDAENLYIIEGTAYCVGCGARRKFEAVVPDCPVLQRANIIGMMFCAFSGAIVGAGLVLIAWWLS